jgi:NAD(P)-dependent dehydrogenase (short-subunit alcohol dehydrogenase family)
MDVRGLRCLVTGAASGIGDAVARRLLAEGADVVSLDRNQPTAEVTRHVAIDLADPASVDAAVAALDGTFDVLANVAGVPGTAPPETVFSVNFLGLRHLTESLFERLDTGGAIVNMSSTAGFAWAQRLEAIRDLLATETFDEGLAWFREHPQPSAGNAYNFSKEAVTVYSMAMAPAVREMNELRMNAVLPGPVETPILADFEESMGRETLDGVRNFLGRHATTEDIAPLVVFLASRDARWVNGAAVIADGGISGAVLTGLVPAPEMA